MIKLNGKLVPIRRIGRNTKIKETDSLTQPSNERLASDSASMMGKAYVEFS